MCRTGSLKAGRKTQFCHFAPESDVSELCRELVSLAAAGRVAAVETKFGTHHRHVGLYTQLNPPASPLALHTDMWEVWQHTGHRGTTLSGKIVSDIRISRKQKWRSDRKGRDQLRIIHLHWVIIIMSQWRDKTFQYFSSADYAGGAA